MGSTVAEQEEKSVGRRNLKGMKLFAGNANVALGKRISEYLGIELGQMTTSRFADGEIQVKIEESARGNDVFILQPTCAPTNDNLMELMIMLDAFRRASASKITVVMPYYGYARQDKKIKPREPITARLVADMLTMAGAQRILAIDLHADQIQGFFNCPVDHLYGGPIIGEYLVKSGYRGRGGSRTCKGFGGDASDFVCGHSQTTPSPQSGGGRGDCWRIQGQDLYFYRRHD